MKAMKANVAIREMEGCKSDCLIFIVFGLRVCPSGTELVEQLSSNRGSFLLAEDRVVENVLEALDGFFCLF